MLCHCLDCRKISGSNYSDNAQIPNANFTLESGIQPSFSFSPSPPSFITSTPLTSLPSVFPASSPLPLSTHHMTTNHPLTSAGTPKTYTMAADSGRSITSFFCPSCGTTLYREAECLPGVKILKTGVLDDPTWQSRVPEAEVWTQRKVAWLPELGKQ